MNYSVLGLAFIILLFSAVLLFLYLGRRYAIYHEKKNPGKKRAGLQMAEGAVFGLMGLLIAFTFAAACEKFDARRMLIIEEANSIGTAYLRLDLLPQNTRKELQADFREYLDLRLAIHHNSPVIKTADALTLKWQQVQNKLWSKVVSAAQATNNSAIPMLLLPAVNSMFDIASKRMAITEIHPPTIVFALLIMVALMSALLGGYSISHRKIGSSLHIICFAAIIAITIYIIIDIEHPRLGFIQVTNFDHVLADLREDMK